MPHFKPVLCLLDNRDLQTCPQGQTSISWTPAIDNRKNEVIKIKFSTKDCQVCPSRSLCTQSSRHTRRTMTIRPHQQYLALMHRREQEKTKEFTQVKASRAGIEGTISKASSDDGYAPFSLHWAGENASATSGYCRCSECWFAASHGSMGFLALRLAVLLLLVSMTLLRGIRQRYQM